MVNLSTSVTLLILILKSDNFLASNMKVAAGLIVQWH